MVQALVADRIEQFVAAVLRADGLLQDAK